MTVRRSTLAFGVLFLVTLWVTAWKLANDRAEVQLAEAQNHRLREEIESNRRYAACLASLEREKGALDECGPAHAQILPSHEVATDEKLLREIQGMAEIAGVRIISVTMQVKR